MTSKTVFSGFMAAWFFAASPIRRSSLVKETKEGVVKLPCSLATARAKVSPATHHMAERRTDLDVGALIVGNARVGRAWRCGLATKIRPAARGRAVRTKIDADGTLVDFVAHDCGLWGY